MTRLADREAGFAKLCRARFLGRPVEWHAALESTQDRATEVARQGGGEGHLVVAVEQTRGRGRGGSSWLSPAGGLWASLVLRPTGSAGEAPRLTRVLADAVCSFLMEEFGVGARVKEPNDVLVGDRKLAGILAEASSRAGEAGLDWMVLGLGLNVSNPVGECLESIATRLADHVPVVPPVELVLARVVERFERAYRP